MLEKVSTVEQLESWLRRTPAILALSDMVTLAFLSEMPRIFDKCIDMICWIENPEPIKEEMLICLSYDARYARRFPHLRCVHNPYTPELDRVLLDRFEFVRRNMICQDGISDIIVEDCRANRVLTIVLILIDGLSYSDVDNWTEFTNKQACLVPGITKTLEGFRSVVGDPPLASRLFNLGFRNRLGYTYWTREQNKTTDLLFRSIPPSSISEGNTIPETLKVLAGRDVSNTYVQIVRVGLDQYAHEQRGEDLEDNREVTLRNIRRELAELTDILKSKGLPAMIYLTSDHGLLWRDQTQFAVIGNAPGGSSPRHYKLDEASVFDKGKGRIIEATEHSYFQLTSNYLRRKLNRNEFGVHGGLSYAESVIPLIKVGVNINVNDRQKC